MKWLMNKNKHKWILYMYSTLFLILLHYTVVYFSYLGNYKLCEGRVFICLMKKSINEYYVSIWIQFILNSITFYYWLFFCSPQLWTLCKRPPIWLKYFYLLMLLAPNAFIINNFIYWAYFLCLSFYILPPSSILCSVL